MATNHLSDAIQQLRRALLPGEEASLTDGQLLECFIEKRDELALGGIVRRHGPMVWGVCRRLLSNHHDAEDAFQATFLVLVRRAAAVVPRESVGNWLYGVARQTALKARATVATRRKRERQMTDMPEPQAVEHGLWPDLQPLLDQELNRLPDKYRVPVVLCDLEGRTRKEVAGQLGCPEGTVAGRLARARARLAKQLARHGLVVTSGTLAAELAEHAASACAPPSLVNLTIEAAYLFVVRPEAAARVVSTRVAALTEGVLQAMLLTKLKKVTAVLLLVLAIVCLGGGLIATEGYLHLTAAGPKGGPGEVPAQVGEKPNPDKEQFAKDPGQKPEAQAAEDAKVKALLKERLATLKEIAAHVEKRFKETALGSLEEVLQAKHQVHMAELDLCESDKERVGIHENIVANARELETLVATRVKAGVAQSVDLLKARVSRLEAEIALERAKAKAAAKPK
jgi:RNA polymerase sigma factor (sigma-70 family)